MIISDNAVIVAKLANLLQHKKAHVEREGVEALQGVGIKWGDDLVHIPPALQIPIISAVLNFYEGDAVDLAETIQNHFAKA